MTSFPWITVGGWLFGALAPVATLAIFAGGFLLIYLLWQLPEHQNFALADTWCGFGLLVVSLIVTGIIVFRFAFFR